MKKLLKITVCFLVLFGCSDDANLLEDIAMRGGYIQFEETPTLKVNIANVDNAVISERLIDPNKNATNYSLNLFYKDKVVIDFLVINSFPATMNIPISDITSALGMTNADIKLNTKFKFVALVTTPTGTFSGETPKFNNENINLGGDTTVRLKATALNDAIEFDITFF